MRTKPKSGGINSATKKKIGITLVSISAAAVLFAGGFFANAYVWHYDVSKQAGITSRADRPSLDRFWTVYELLQTKFDGQIDKEKYIEGAISGAVASLDDPYTVYLDARAAKELADQLGGKLSGVGIEIGIKKGKLTVIAPLDDSPASRAGLQAGDIITQVDGADASAFSIDEAVSKIRGEKGTKVKLKILRGNEEKEYEITRDDIHVNSVKSEIKPGNIGYLKINEFGDDTVAAVKKSASEFKQAGVKAVVIDLRNNPGGYLQGAVDVTSVFSPTGTVVSEKGKETAANQTYEVNGDATLADVPIIILTNNGTASASEITAGALRENRGAKLIGEKTYGKGVVQDIRDLDGGRQLKVTIAKWFTPKGINISKEGLSPDIEVKNSDADNEAGRDPQLDRALIEAAKQ